MKKIFYEKKGRRYVPVSEYDSDYLDSFPKGNHLVMCYPGGSSRRFNIDPALAPMIAAGRVAEDSIAEVIRKAGEIRPTKSPLNLEQRTAYEKLMDTLPDNERYYMTYGCARDAAEAGVKAMMVEADKLMGHESVRKAYDHFMLMCKLVKEKEND